MNDNPANAGTTNCSLSTTSKAADESKVVNIDHPSYAAAFRCIGPRCEDPCCGDWDIPLDQDTYERYQSFPNDGLGATVSQFVILNEPNQPKELYGLITRRPSGLCPFYSADHLCAIQAQYGPKLLSASCSIYPRSLSVVYGSLEGTLSLSCPEAARILLLTPDFTNRICDLHSGEFRTDNVYHLANTKLELATDPRHLFLSVRRMLINVILDRSTPLWDRLLRVGYMCQKLDLMDTNGAEFLTQTYLLTVAKFANNTSLQEHVNKLERNPNLRVETLFGLTEMLMRYGSSVRFQDTFWSFVIGIGHSMDSPATDDIESFLHAERKYFTPFVIGIRLS